jgi:hypothetical protein
MPQPSQFNIEFGFIAADLRSAMCTGCATPTSGHFGAGSKLKVVGPGTLS